MDQQAPIFKASGSGVVGYVCDKCEKAGKEEHDCPYSHEMGGGQTCNCCEHCTKECAMDI